MFLFPIRVGIYLLFCYSYMFLFCLLNRSLNLYCFHSSFAIIAFSWEIYLGHAMCDVFFLFSQQTNVLLSTGTILCNYAKPLKQKQSQIKIIWKQKIHQTHSNAHSRLLIQSVSQSLACASNNVYNVWKTNEWEREREWAKYRRRGEICRLCRQRYLHIKKQ